MIVEPVFAKDVFLIKPKVYSDKRGFFYEFFNARVFEEQTGLQANFIQDNLAQSQQWVLRGFHFQKGAFAQAKLVSVLKGAVLDVIVDLRQSAPTYGQYFSVELNEYNKYQLFIPRGFAHAYLSLMPDTLFYYKVDNKYHQPAESGIRFDDPDLNVDWGVSADKFLLSPKDLQLPFFKDILL